MIQNMLWDTPIHLLGTRLVGRLGTGNWEVQDEPGEPEPPKIPSLPTREVLQSSQGRAHRAVLSLDFPFR